MVSAEALNYMTPDQKKRISRLGVQTREMRRMALAPPEYPPIPEGLQMAAVMLDFRTLKTSEHTILLFQAGDYLNRYRWILGNEKQRGLIGWHDAIRSTAGLFKPIRRYD